MPAPPTVLADLNRRRILRAEDTTICDKGYYAYDNYTLTVGEFRLIPVISPEEGFDPAKMLRRMHYPLRIFSHHDHHKVQLVYKRLVRTLQWNQRWWEGFVAIRFWIEDVSILAKNVFALRKLRWHLRRSVVKIVAVNVLLVGATIAASVDEMPTRTYQLLLKFDRYYKYYC